MAYAKDFKMSYVVMYLMKKTFAFDKHVTSPRSTLATHSTLAPHLTLALSEYNNPLRSLGTKHNLNTVPNCPGILPLGYHGLCLENLFQDNLDNITTLVY